MYTRNVCPGVSYRRDGAHRRLHHAEAVVGGGNRIPLRGRGEEGLGRLVGLVRRPGVGSLPAQEEEDAGRYQGNEC